MAMAVNCGYRRDRRKTAILMLVTAAFGATFVGMTVLGVGIGAPIGLFAGTYLAEYGRNDKLTSVIRFINDILLSAPSIIIGLFIYGAVVVPMRGFSAIAGTLALAVIVIPVVLRTTEDMLKPGFFDHVQKMSLLLKQKLASVVDRYPSVISEVRGEGLLVGVKAVVPSGDLVNALREQKLLTVGAGDNVVRFLAPLIVNESEIEQAVASLERACVALSAAEKKKAAG